MGSGPFRRHIIRFREIEPGFVLLVEMIVEKTAIEPNQPIVGVQAYCVVVVFFGLTEVPFQSLDVAA